MSCFQRILLVDLSFDGLHDLPSFEVIHAKVVIEFVEEDESRI